MKIIASQEELLAIADRHASAAYEMVGGTYHPEQMEEARMRIDLEHRLLRQALSKAHAVQVDLTEPIPLPEDPYGDEPKPAPKKSMEKKVKPKKPSKRLTPKEVHARIKAALKKGPATVAGLVKSTGVHRKRTEEVLDVMIAAEEIGYREDVLMKDARGRERAAVAYGSQKQLAKLTSSL